MVAVRKFDENILNDTDKAICPCCKALNYIDSTCSLIICDNCTNVFNHQIEEKKEYQLSLPFETDNVVRINFSNNTETKTNFYSAIKIISLIFGLFTLISFLNPSFLTSSLINKNSNIKLQNITHKNTNDVLAVSFDFKNIGNKTIRNENLLLNTFDSTGKIITSEIFSFNNKIKKTMNEKFNLVSKLQPNSQFYSLQLVSAK